MKNIVSIDGMPLEIIKETQKAVLIEYQKMYFNDKRTLTFYQSWIPKSIFYNNANIEKIDNSAFENWKKSTIADLEVQIELINQRLLDDINFISGHINNNNLKNAIQKLTMESETRINSINAEIKVIKMRYNSEDEYKFNSPFWFNLKSEKIIKKKPIKVNIGNHGEGY